MERRVNEGQRRGRGMGEEAGRVGVVPVESYQYTKVTPRHLRGPACVPPPASPAHHYPHPAPSGPRHPASRAPTDDDGGGDSGGGGDDREEEDDAGTYCALKKVSLPELAATPVGGAGFISRKWSSEKRRQKEEWCPLRLRGKDRLHSEGNLGPSGRVWQDPHLLKPNTRCEATRPHRQGPARHVTEKPTESVPLSTSAPEGPFFQGLDGSHLTLEQACQLVFPHRPLDQERRESWDLNAGRQRDSGGEGQTDVETDTSDRGGSSQDGNQRLAEGQEVRGLAPTHSSDSLPATEPGSTVSAQTPTLTVTAVGEASDVVVGVVEGSQEESTVKEDSVTSQSPQPSDHFASTAAVGEEEVSHRFPEPADTAADETQAVSILRTCSACLSHCGEVHVLQCFHLLCGRCLGVCEEDDTLRCSLCGAVQPLPPCGEVPLLRHLFPGLFHLMPDTPPPHTVAGEEDGADSVRAGCDTHEEKTVKPAAATVTEPSTAPEHAEPAPPEQSSISLQTAQFPPQAPPTSRGSGHVHDVNADHGNNDDNADNDDADNCSTPSLSTEESCPPDTGDSMDLTDSLPARSRLTSTETSDDNGVGGSKDAKMEVTVKVRVCGACHAQADPRHACVTCGGIGLCAGCHVAHLNLPVTRHHELVELPPPSSSSASSSSTLTPSSLPLSPLVLLAHHRPLCGAHGQDLALTCRTCSQLLCHRCLTPHHVGHEVQELGQLHHRAQKNLSALRRHIKQHALSARSSHRAVGQQRGRVLSGRQSVHQAIHAAATRQQRWVTSETQRLSQDAEQCTRPVLQRLADSLQGLSHVQRELDRLRCLLNAATADTPHLTTLILFHTCQAWFNHLRQAQSLQVEQVGSVTFTPDLSLEDQLTCAAPTLGRVCTLTTSVPDISCIHVHSVIQTAGEVSSLALTPYKEVVSLSSPAHTCQVWDRQGALLADVSRHVTDPAQVKVTPSGLLMILGRDVTRGSSQIGGGGRALVTLLSPAGSFLTSVGLPSALRHTHMDCPTRSRLLVSDGEEKTITLYGLDLRPHPHPHHLDPTPDLTVLRQVDTTTTLITNPCHVTVTVTGDWLVNDRGYFMRVVSPEDHVTTVLSDDEPDAVLQPPPTSSSSQVAQRCCQRVLGDVCCDSLGRMMAVNSGKNGLYIVTSGSVACGGGGGERHFLSLEELVPPSCHVTAMTVDQDGDVVVVGMSDGTVCLLTLGLDAEVGEGEEGMEDFLDIGGAGEMNSVSIC
ncbi:uncharacterized protein LOC143282482 [Babylonia areolata]|uniref:uncharacterized protein LOC143282482 n=1 Tax=Babylonia areolata TaxID=304850 RepID=UPI003FD54F52